MSVILASKSAARTAVLKGAGVALSLPLLDAMIPAATALAQTAAAPKLRAGYMVRAILQGFRGEDGAPLVLWFSPEPRAIFPIDRGEPLGYRGWVGNDLPYALFLPAYAATAQYHGTLQGALMVAGATAIGLYAYGLFGGFGGFADALGAASHAAPFIFADALLAE